jgi:hypothetical protein
VGRIGRIFAEIDIPLVHVTMLVRSWTVFTAQTDAKQISIYKLL